MTAAQSVTEWSHCIRPISTGTLWLGTFWPTGTFCFKTGRFDCGTFWQWDVLTGYPNNGSIEQAPGSGRPRTTRTAQNVDAVGDMVQSQENQPQTHRSARQILRDLGIPQTNNWKWLFSVLFCYERKCTKNNSVLTEKCRYWNLRSKVRTQLRWCGKFYHSRMYNLFAIKMI